jgi:ABC-type Zn2+ transport system substrate-binding protein/surface adhesin
MGTQRSDIEKPLTDKQKQINATVYKLEDDKKALKLLDDVQRGKNADAVDAFRQDTKDQSDKIRSDRDDALANADKAAKAAIKLDYANRLIALKAKRKADLAKLKADHKAKLAAIKDNVKKDIAKINKSIMSVYNDGRTTGFYTDKNGIKRPLSAPKGK